MPHFIEQLETILKTHTQVCVRASKFQPRSQVFKQGYEDVFNQISISKWGPKCVQCDLCMTVYHSTEDC